MQRTNVEGSQPMLDAEVRVWDQFLTARDKHHRARLGAPHNVGIGERPALLMIDHTISTAGAEPVDLLDGMSRWPLHCGLEGWEALQRSKVLLEVARSVNMPVIHSLPDFSGEQTAPILVPDRPDKEDPSAWAPHPLVAPAGEELIIRKQAPSAFFGTALVRQLILRNIDTLVVTGNTTSGCVRATVVDGASYGYRMIVIEDCVYDRTEAAHAMSLFDLHHKYCDVVKSDVLIDWAESRQHS